MISNDYHVFGETAPDSLANPHCFAITFFLGMLGALLLIAPGLNLGPWTDDCFRGMAEESGARGSPGGTPWDLPKTAPQKPTTRHKAHKQC